MTVQYMISDYGSVLILGFNENTLISNKSCKGITGNGKVVCSPFQMKGRRKEYGQSPEKKPHR